MAIRNVAEAVIFKPNAKHLRKNWLKNITTHIV